MADPNADMDPQDAAEAFDEDNLDPTEANKYRTFEEIPDLLDLTRADGDEDDEEDDVSTDGIDGDDLEDEIEAVRSDGYNESDLDDPVDLDALDHVSDQSADEATLVYVGDVENLKGAQSSAAHFEPRAPLADDDIESLGYGSDNEEG